MYDMNQASTRPRTPKLRSSSANSDSWLSVSNTADKHSKQAPTSVHCLWPLVNHCVLWWVPFWCCCAFSTLTDVLAWSCSHQGMSLAENQRLFLAASTEIISLSQDWSFKLNHIQYYSSSTGGDDCTIVLLWEAVRCNWLVDRDVDNSVRNSMTIHVGNKSLCTCPYIDLIVYGLQPGEAHSS